MNECRLKWCAALGRLCNPDHPDESTAALVAMLPMLADIPDAAFASKSALDAVACAPRYTRTPTYADIRGALREWIKETAPIRTALPAPRIPDRTEPTDAERAYVRDLVAKLRAEVREREQAAAQKLRDERRTAYQPKTLSRETLAMIYEREGVRGPRVA